MPSPSPSRAGPRRPSASGVGRAQPPGSSDEGTSASAPAALVTVIGSPPRAVRNIPAELLPSSHTEEDTPMEVDEPAPIAPIAGGWSVPEVSEIPEVVQPVAGPSTPVPKPPIASTTPKPFAQPASAPLVTPAAPAPVTPAPKNAPRSTRKTPAQSAQAAQVLDTPAVPIPGDSLEYGRRWESTMNTLELAARAGAQKWT
jgi:hypothetical protein